MSRVTIALALVLGFCAFASRGADEVIINDISFKEGRLWIEFENDGDKDVVFLSRLDPEFGVLKLNVKNSKGEDVKLSAHPKDWVAGPDDRLRIRSRYRVTRPITLELQPGHYTVTATYEVKKESPFMDAWFMKKQDTRANDSKKVMNEFWFGTLTSKEFEFEVPSIQHTAAKP
jgi:hypothetical protein